MLTSTFPAVAQGKKIWQCREKCVSLQIEKDKEKDKQ